MWISNPRKMSFIYQPAEDSYLLSEVLKKEIKNKEIKVLEIGSGSGIQIDTLLILGLNPCNIFSTDINPVAVNYLKKKFPNIKIIKSYLFSKVKEKFDIIIFNPPYLPEEHREPKSSQLATTGGKQGSKIINRFLKQAKNHLNKNGKIYLITSSLTKDVNWKGYERKVLARKKLFFEEIYIWELKI